MSWNRFLRRVVVGVLALVACQLSFSQTAEKKTAAKTAAPPPAENGLVITAEELPNAFPRIYYRFNFLGKGNYIPVLHWRVEKGTLPPGMMMADDGVLYGAAERAGEFQFTVSATDGGKPQQAVQKQFVLKVIAAMTLVWKTPAHVTGNRIDGTVEVTNTTPDDIDLTFVAMAVAENGRATAIGYQRFPLKKGTVAMELPFGETLPHGAYVVHVDAVGEVASKHAIYRERMQTPAPLQVVVGP